MPVAAAAGTVVLVWATVAGPARMIGPPRTGPMQPVAPPSRTVSPVGPPHSPALPPVPHPPAGGGPLSWVGDLLSWTVLLLVALALVAGVVWLWQNRWRRPAAPRATRFEVLPTVELAEELERTSGERLAAVEAGDPRNGIVACWLLVEESIAAVGLPRRPWETSTEFTVRVLHNLDIDPRPIGSMARLYREARFSEHPMGEDRRAEARAAVLGLEAELRTLNAAAAALEGPS